MILLANSDSGDLRPTCGFVQRADSENCPTVARLSVVCRWRFPTKGSSPAVSQVQLQRLQAAPERDCRHILELGVLFHTLLQRIVRDARAQVMDVVEPDVAGEPLQH